MGHGKECIVCKDLVKNAQEYGKGTSQAEVTSNSKKIKPIALAIVKLQESEGISHQSVSQSGSLAVS